MADNNDKIITLSSLSDFKEFYDIEVDAKIAQGGGGVSPEQKAIWDAKYDKPEGGIPASDLASAVQTSLGKADTALQSFTESDPTVPSHVKSITQANITSWNGKQDKLTAGSNITIEGNVISATGGGASGNFVESIDGGSKTIDELWELVRHTHGAHGSVSLVKKESGVGSDIPAGWYNFYHSPHRNGGDDGDNNAYGTIILAPMTGSNNSWIVRCTGGNVAEVKVIIDSGNIRSQSVGSADQAYKLITTSDRSEYADLSWFNDLARYYLKVKASDGTDRNVAVDYATAAGWATNAGSADKVWTQSHQNEWYINSNWNGSHFLTNAKSTDNSELPIGVDYSGSTGWANNGNINLYVGNDGKLHWVNWAGADSALPFKSQTEIIYDINGFSTKYSPSFANWTRQWTYTCALTAGKIYFHYFFINNNTFNSWSASAGVNGGSLKKIWSIPGQPVYGMFSVNKTDTYTITFTTTGESKNHTLYIYEST